MYEADKAAIVTRSIQLNDDQRKALLAEHTASMPTSSKILKGSAGKHIIKDYTPPRTDSIADDATAERADQTPAKI